MTIDSERSDDVDALPSKHSADKPSLKKTATEPRAAGIAGGVTAGLAGLLISAAFYAFVYWVPIGPMQRYFLGHPVAVAATILFWIAAGVLLGKWLGIVDQSNRMAAIRDGDLMPGPGENTPASRWLDENDAGHVARRWQTELNQLPAATRSSLLVSRLQELLTRQSQRGTAKHLADDLRELSGRDADAAHDSLGLVRIIVWAIPMLGFLGTVIGITQTLGGLDFSNGTAAVDNLKSGLYVAFDTTALGLVLSVVAIFLQFPVERSEQRLLAEIDARVGHLASSSLPGDEASDNQTVLIADLCKGVQAAVAESLENQAKLWRDTIDEAQNQWQSAHDHNTNRLAEAFELTLVPALIRHGESLDESSRVAGDRLATECDKWKATLDEAHQRMTSANDATANVVLKALEESFRPALHDHAASLEESGRLASHAMEQVWDRCHDSIEYHADALTSQQQSILAQFESLNEVNDRADAIAKVQTVMDDNLRRLDQTNESIDKSIDAAAGYGMADAMRVLARAVDVLTARMAEDQAAGRRHGGPDSGDHSTNARRAA